jgi:DNA-directed RNA polymerase specialized sigma subunit
MPEGTSSGRRKPGASSRLSKIGSMNCTVPAKAGPSKNWRTSRLNLARRRELKALVSGTAENKRGEDALGPWLLSAMPVHTYLEITDLAVPNLRAIDPAADDCRRQLIRMRDSLFGANFGLVRNAAMNPGSRDYNERLSAASRGLLDAIDRYVPGPRAARFSYFASYWIRYHVSRHAQKFDSLISFPINQQRIGRQIERHLDECSANGKQPPSLAQLCAEMGISLDAYYWSRCRPKVVSMHDCAGSEHGSCTFEHLLLDPGPEPYDALDQRETAAQLKSLLRAHVCPETRIMLAYVRGIGALSEAAQDHLDQLRESARTRLGKLAEGLRCHHQTRHPALLDPQSRIDTLSACRMPIQSPSLLPD